jgi:hypothetical protein
MKKTAETPYEASPVLSSAERERLLRQTATANDGLWFYAVNGELGIEAANRLNAEVVRKFATLEMARLLRALRCENVADQQTFVSLLRQALELFVDGLFEASLEESPGKLRLRVERCFAYEGVRRANLHLCYRCGPGQRLLGWLAALDVPSAVSPEVGLCQMAHRGQCEYDVDLSRLAVRHK